MKYSFYVLLMFCAIFYACSEDPVQERIITGRTVIVYMAADNNLDYYAAANIKKME